jgi:hypothetical protein
MATLSVRSVIEQARTAPLPLGAVAATALVVWLAGAIYCSGYEMLLTGLDNWPGSLWWSAVAVLPWFALFEWSKSERGRRLTRRAPMLAMWLVATAFVSLLLEYLANALLGAGPTPVALAIIRRLPAIGASLLLITWARSARAEEAATDQSLPELASSIDWLAAADNYVELHIGGHVVMRRMTMREAEKALGGRGFVRIHRRYLVNRQRVIAVVGNGSKRLRLHGGTELPVGQRYAANLTPNS